MAELVPPNSLEAEAAVLSACLLDAPRCLDVARGIVSESSWYSDANRSVWRAITAVSDRRAPVDVVTVSRHLRDSGQLERIGGMTYLAQLADGTPAVAHVEAHAQIVADKARQRRVIDVLRAAAAEGYTAQDATEWCLDVVRRVTDTASVVPRDPAETAAQILPRVLAEAAGKQRGRVGTAGIDTGWKALNRVTSGWRRGKVHVVGGRPGMGKTSYLLCAALNVAKQGLGVVFVSAEMTKEELIQRALSVESDVDTRKVETGNLSPAEWSAVSSAAEALGKIPIVFLYRPGARVTEIRAVVRTEQQRLEQAGCELGMVVVDYLQILDGEREKGETREAEVSRLSRKLMWLAAEFNVALLLASQLNRAVESRSNASKRPTMADLRESGAIEQDAYTISLLYRDEYYNKESEFAGKLEVIISKNRGGETPTVMLAFVATSTRVEDDTSNDFDWHGYEES